VRAVLTGIAQNAGAERAVFVLRGGDRAETVYGELHAGSYRDVAAPLDRYTALPGTVVRAVRRTGRPVGIADAAGDPAYAADPFVVENRCRSIAGVPVRHKGKVMGLRVLEARVEDRTRALRRAQEQLIESARKAGMADVAIEVLHSVGNALNSVNV